MDSETIHYEITVTNNSEEMLNNLQVRDMKKSGDGIVGTIPTLPSGASETVGFDYTVTQADVDAGKVVNVAWIDLNDTTGNSTGYMTVYSNEVYIPTIHAPAEVSVFKSEETSSIDPAGYELYHTAQGLVGVTNHADVPLLDVDIYDLPNGDTTGYYLGRIAQIDLRIVFWIKDPKLCPLLFEGHLLQAGSQVGRGVGHSRHTVFQSINIETTSTDGKYDIVLLEQRLDDS